MAFDNELAQRIAMRVRDFGHWDEKKMFGGLCFMLNGNMLCGVMGDDFMARVGPDQYQDCLTMEGARKMDFTGKPLTGFVVVDGGVVAEDEALNKWLEYCYQFVSFLPPK